MGEDGRNGTERRKRTERTTALKRTRRMSRVSDEPGGILAGREATIRTIHGMRTTDP